MAPIRARDAALQSNTRSIGAYYVWLLFSFDGRLSRHTYRYSRIVANLLYVAVIYGLTAASRGAVQNLGLELLLLVLMLAVLPLMLWTTLAMQVKRRHDRDKSWPWLFVGFIPMIGPFWVLIETCWLEGTPGLNRFDDPDAIAARTFD